MKKKFLKHLSIHLLKFRDKDYTQETIRNFHAPAISLTKDGDYNDIRFSVATMDTLDCHP